MYWKGVVTFAFGLTQVYIARRMVMIYYLSTPLLALVELSRKDVRERNRPAYSHSIRGSIDTVRVEEAQIELDTVFQGA